MRSKTEEQWHCRSRELLIQFCNLNSSVSDVEQLCDKVQNQSTSGQSKIEQLVFHVSSLVVRCKQILFKSTKLNRERLTRGGEIRGRGGASEPGERVQVAAQLETQAVEKLRSSSLLLCITYLQYCVLWEQTTLCIRRPQRERETKREREKESAGVSVKGAQGHRAASNLCPSQVAENRSQQEDTAI